MNTDTPLTKFEPVIVTTLPPAKKPLLGVIAIIAGPSKRVTCSAAIKTCSM